jgi:hypothetical protein
MLGTAAECYLQQSHSEGAGDPDAIVHRWLVDAIERSGLKPTPFALKAKLSPSTILRNLDGKGSLDRRSIDKIVSEYRIPGPPIYGEASAATPGFSEAELASYTSDVPTWWKLELSPRQGLWQVNTRALELAGVLPGDVILVDSNIAPRTPREGEERDIVVAQILTAGSAETVIRIYDPPYLITETADPAARRKPLLVDNDRVSIWGVQIKLFRERKD